MPLLSENQNMVDSVNNRKLVCLTPIKDEAWILDHFLNCAAQWADDIIIADQGSTDGSREIARAHPKVTLIDNPSKEFNEPERQKLLLTHARKIAPSGIYIALDADEALCASFERGTEWQRILNLPAGTTVRFRWVNLLPDFKRGWSPEKFHAWGFIDDGTEHVGNRIHSPRVPVTKNTFDCEAIRVLHYQYVDWSRMKSKQRWYMAWEWLNNDAKSTVQMHRMYTHMYAFRRNKVKSIDNSLLHDFSPDSISIGNANRGYRWDKLVLDMLSNHGTKTFEKVPLWDVSWVELAKHHKYENPERFRDPRNKFNRLLQRFLTKTQDPRFPRMIRAVDLLLRILGR